MIQNGRDYSKFTSTLKKL